MAVGWDYMAESKGAAEGARIANARNSNAIASQKQADYQRQLKERDRQNQERAALAQENVIKQSEEKDRDTFYKQQGVSESAGLNTIFDHSTQQIVDTYTRIKNDKDMDSSEQALMMRKITNQIPLIKNAKQLLDTNMAKFAELSQTGQISESMDPKFQYVYSEMLANRFNGGIDFVGDELVFQGTMPDGEEIKLPLKDFALNLPGVNEQAGTLDDSVDAYTDDLTNQIAQYRKDGKKRPESIFKTNEDGTKVLTQTGDAKRDAILKLIQGDNKSGNELYAYGMDTMNLSRESIDNRIKMLTDTEQTTDIVAPGILKSMYTDKGLEIPENFQPKAEKMTSADAREQVMDEMINQELTVLQSVFDRAKGGINYTMKPSLVDDTYSGIMQEAQDSLSTGTLGLTAQDFNVGKSAGFDNIASNIQEGFNDDGQYVVSYEQANTGPYTENVDGTPIEPRRISYNLSTTGGAKDFLLARFENEQGGRASNAKDTKESKEDALKLAPVLAKSFKDFIQAQKDAEAAAAAAEAARLKQQQIMQNNVLNSNTPATEPGVTDFSLFKRPTE